jgi:hypothetical protein
VNEKLDYSTNCRKKVMAAKWNKAMSQNVSVEKELEVKMGPGHVFRLASEVDPRNKTSRGGFLEGEIQLPKLHCMEVELSCIPSIKLEEEHPELGNFCPCLIYNARKKGGRLLYDRMAVPYLQHYRQTLKVENGVVYIKKNISKFDEGRPIGNDVFPNWDKLFDINSDNKLYLGRNDNHVNLQILYPKDETRSKDANDITVVKLLDNRNLDKNLANIFSVGKRISNKNDKIRIKVVIKDKYGQTITSGSSQDIVCTKSKNFGSLTIFDRVPNTSCSAGGCKISMLSETKLSGEVRPEFQLWSRLTKERVGESEERLLLSHICDNMLCRCIDSKIQCNTVVFKTPPMPKLEEILANDYEFKLVARRQSDNSVSNAMPFFYVRSGLMPCHHEEFKSVEVAIPGGKKRKMPHVAQVTSGESPRGGRDQTTTTRYTHNLAKFAPAGAMRTDDVKGEHSHRVMSARFQYSGDKCEATSMKDSAVPAEGDSQVVLDTDTNSHNPDTSSGSIGRTDSPKVKNSRKGYRSRKKTRKSISSNNKRWMRTKPRKKMFRKATKKSKQNHKNKIRNKRKTERLPQIQPITHNNPHSKSETSDEGAPDSEDKGTFHNTSDVDSTPLESKTFIRRQRRRMKNKKKKRKRWKQDKSKLMAEVTTADKKVNSDQFFETHENINNFHMAIESPVGVPIVSTHRTLLARETHKADSDQQPRRLIRGLHENKNNFHMATEIPVGFPVVFAETTFDKSVPTRAPSMPGIWFADRPTWYIPTTRKVATISGIANMPCSCYREENDVLSKERTMRHSDNTNENVNIPDEIQSEVKLIFTHRVMESNMSTRFLYKSGRNCSFATSEAEEDSVVMDNSVVLDEDVTSRDNFSASVTVVNSANMESSVVMDKDVTSRINFSTNVTVVESAMKFTISDRLQPSNQLLRAEMGHFLATLRDPDLSMHHLVAFNSAAHRKPSFARDLLKELIHEVEMGPFAHEVSVQQNPAQYAVFYYFYWPKHKKAMSPCEHCLAPRGPMKVPSLQQPVQIQLDPAMFMQTRPATRFNTRFSAPVQQYQQLQALPPQEPAIQQGTTEVSVQQNPVQFAPRMLESGLRE